LLVGWVTADPASVLHLRRLASVLHRLDRHAGRLDPHPCHRPARFAGHRLGSDSDLALCISSWIDPAGNSTAESHLGCSAIGGTRTNSAAPSYRRLFVQAMQATATHHEECDRIIRVGLSTLAKGSPLGTDVIRNQLRQMTTRIMFRVLFGLSEDSPVFSKLEASYQRFDATIRDEHACAFADIIGTLQRVARDLPRGFLGRKPEREKFAPFGFGQHHCVGANLVVGLSTLFVQRLLEKYTLVATKVGSPHRGTWHWQPSPICAIQLTSRSSRPNYPTTLVN